MTIDSILDFIKEILLKPTLLFATWFVVAVVHTFEVLRLCGTHVVQG
jgi:hypothetical protein